MQQYQFYITSSVRALLLAVASSGAVALGGCDQDPVLPQYVPPTQTTTMSGANTGAAGQGSSKPADGGTKATTTTKPKPAATVPDDDSDGGIVDASEPEGLRADGDACGSNDECASGHCNGDLCCGDGSCCVVDADCPGAGKVGNVCDYHATCQGTRGTIKCQNFRCVALNGAPNDTQCDEDVEANDCGPYQSVYCSGASDQRAPQCPGSCKKDDECDRNAHCVDGACVRMTAAPRCTSNAMCARGETCTGGRCVASSTSGGTASSCMERVGTDRCAECACSKCGTTTTACYNSGDAKRDGLCMDLVKCGLAADCVDATDCSTSANAGGALNTYGCFGRSCFCGSSTDCYNNPTGMCAKEIEAAGGGTSNVTDLQTRRGNRQYASYYAEQHAQCLERSCRSECGL